MTDHSPAGDVTNHDRLPAHIFDAAFMAAFPGLPETVTMDQAARRVAAALNAAWPLIERDVRAQIAHETAGDALSAEEGSES